MRIRSRRIGLMILCALLACGCGAKRARSSQQPRVRTSRGLDCEKYKLSNGMTVILHTDHTLPVAGINLWYRVGARNEPPGRSGFAHLFEHLMFMGTKRAPGSSFDDFMEAGGGSNNASTDLDRTNYFSSGPSSILPLLLWLDADRLEDLGPTMTVEKLNLQRDVVRNEIRQNVENSPYGRAEEVVFQLLYPPEHPYHKGVYGTHADLEAATVNDVKDFFSTFYCPDNCSLVVAGNFDPRAIKRMIEQYFGTLPRGEPPVYRKVEPPRLDRVVRRTMLDKVQLPKVAYAYNSPPAYKDGDAEMSLLADILAEGKDSRLYQRLVMHDQTAVSVSAGQNGAALGSVFRIDVLAKPDADLTKIEQAVDEEIARVVKDGPTTDEVRRRAATTELSILSSLQSVMARADRLNEYEYYFGNPDSLQRDLDRYRAATADSVRRWAARVLTPGARAIIHVLPEERQQVASPRDQRPGELPTTEFQPPQPVVLALSNGLPLYVFPRHDLPVVGCTILINPPGTVDDSAHAGAGSLAAAMTQEGAGDRDSVAFAQAAAALGASISAGADDESLSLSMQVLARNFEPAAALLADAALRPRMQQPDFDRLKAVRLDELRQEDEQPQAVAARVAERMLVSESSRYGLPAQGTVATVSPLTLDDVKAAYERLLHDGSAKVLVAGDVDPQQAKAVLEKALSGWPGKASGTRANEAIGFRAADHLRVFIVDRPGAVQTAIHLAAPGILFSDPHRVDAHLANIVLGGSFTSRLNRNLREVHGYTYGARSRLASGRTLGTFHASSAVKADVTGPALGEFLKELKRLAGGDITPRESTKARETFRNDTIESFGTLDRMLRETARLLTDAAPMDTPARDLGVAARADAAELNGAAKRLNLDRAVLVLVGDRKLILEQIKPSNLPPPTEVNAQGAPASRASD